MTNSSFGFGGYSQPLTPKRHKPRKGELWTRRPGDYPSAGRATKFTYIASLMFEVEGQDDQEYWVVRNDASEYKLYKATPSDWVKSADVPDPLPMVEFL